MEYIKIKSFVSKVWRACAYAYAYDNAHSYGAETKTYSDVSSK